MCYTLGGLLSFLRIELLHKFIVSYIFVTICFVCNFYLQEACRHIADTRIGVVADGDDGGKNSHPGGTKHLEQGPSVGATTENAPHATANITTNYCKILTSTC